MDQVEHSFLFNTNLWDASIKKYRKSNRFDDLSPRRDETFSCNATEVGDALEKLIRNRGLHRAAFTKLEEELGSLIQSNL